MPCRLHIKIREARGLPVMDKASFSTDAYCEVKFANLPPQKTKIIPKSLRPEWRQDFKFEVQRDKHLQDAPVEFKVFDHDVVRDDIIGGVNIDITCLLSKKGPPRISGWFPIYDSIRGIRGSLNIAVKLEFVDNNNKFREISAGVKFLSSNIPLGKYKLGAVFGFVEELIVEDDPEYNSFLFSTSRTTNEQRRNIFYHISGKLRRKIGIIVQNLGGNAVLGYQQHFDLEGESGKGIVARGYGTACYISRDLLETQKNIEKSISPSSSLSSEWDTFNNSISPRSLPVAVNSTDNPTSLNFDFSGQILLLSLTIIPPIFTVQIGGIVAVKAVKILKKTHRRRNRDKWWNAMRNEIRSHAKILNCNTVFGYTETTTIEEDIVILSSFGTACKVHIDDNDRKDRKERKKDILEEIEKKDRKKEKKEKKRKKKTKKKCSSYSCHSPLSSNPPYQMRLRNCRICNKAKVGDIILSTTEPCANISLASRGILLQARVCHKFKKKTEGKESNATAISKLLPFIEFDLHRQIDFKLKLLGANACFGLQFQINLGSNMITAVATGTAILVEGIPINPYIPPLNESNIPQFLWKYHEQRENLLQSKYISDASIDSDDISIEYDSNSEDKSPFVLSTDDTPYEEMYTLVDPPLPDNMRFFTLQKPIDNIPIIDSRLIISFVRISWESTSNKNINQQFSEMFQQNMRKIIFELCNFIPCSLLKLQFQLCLPQENVIDFLITGMALHTEIESSIEQDIEIDTIDDTIFPIDQPETIDLKASTAVLPTDDTIIRKRTKSKTPKSPLRVSIDIINAQSLNQKDPITITTLGYIPNQKIKRYIGRVSHHLIREGKEIKEATTRKKLGSTASIFLREAISIARADILGMGADALINFNIDIFSLVASQAYCLISFSGDAVVLRRRDGKIKNKNL